MAAFTFAGSRFTLFVCSLVAALTGAGCFSTKHLPPPAAPAKTLPAIDYSGPVEPGTGRIVLDVEGDQARVTRVRGASVSAGGLGRAFGGSMEVSQVLCVSPCASDLPVGQHTLRLASTTDPERTAEIYVNVVPGKTGVRAVLGQSQSKTGRRILGWLTAAVAAFVDLGAIAVVSASGNEFKAGPSIRSKVGISVTGLAISGLAAWLLGTSTSVSQPGNATQWRFED